MSAAAAPRQWTIDRGAPGYPACLRDLEPAERPVLHGVGERPTVERLEHRTTVTIVGARQASAYGIAVAERLGWELGCAGVTVVSGMARGIDAAAHRGALAGGGTTLAVLAGGPDVVYPPGQRDLYRRVLGSGAAISEHPPGSVPHRHRFPARNRIMAALGSVVVIVEAAQPSGSLITADLAAKLGRTVGAVPGQLGVRVAEGTNDLIKDGAHLIRDGRDVLDLLFGVGAGVKLGVAADAGRQKLARAPKPRPGPALEPPLREVLAAVEAGSVTVDRVASGCGLAPREAAIALARLERLGYLRADALGAHARTGLEPRE
jgi:DNA processing protein